MTDKLYTCPCCGYKTLEGESPGSFEICPVCYWEDDNVQFEEPHYEGGANEVSLYQAQRNFLEFGASSKDSIDSVRKVLPTEHKDTDFKIIE